MAYSTQTSLENYQQRRNKFDLDLFLCTLFVLTLPLTNYSFFLGSLRIEPQRFLLILGIFRLILYCLTSKTQSRQFRQAIALAMPIFLVAIYALILTAFQSDFVQSIRVVSTAEINSFILKRGFKYISYILFFLYITITLNHERKVYHILQFLAIALGITEVLGLLQEAVFLISGIDLFPIIRSSILSSAIETQSVTVNVLGVRFLRINSLANEPKALGIYLSFLFLIKFYWHHLAHLPSSRWMRQLHIYMTRTLGLSILAILLTFSGSSLIALTVSFLIIFILSFYQGQVRKIVSISLQNKIDINWIKNACIVIFFAIASLTILAIFIDDLSNKIMAFLDASILRRLGDLFADFSLESFYESADPEDGATVWNLIHYPQLVFTGLGYGAFSNISFSFFDRYYSDGFSPFSRNILVEVIFSAGIPGFIILTYFFQRINLLTKRYCNHAFSLVINLMLVPIILINVFIRGIEPLFFMTLGLLAATYLNYHNTCVEVFQPYHKITSASNDKL